MRASRIREQLGMSQGAANHLLRRQVMFVLAGRCDMLDCFACGKRIEDVAEFSLEHKLPWEGRDASLFWDLDNIAFSHRRCNTTHRNPGSTGRAKRVGFA